MQNAPHTARRGRQSITQARNNVTHVQPTTASLAASEVTTSNQTTNHFLGMSQRSWMIGEALLPGLNQNAPCQNTSSTSTDLSSNAHTALQNAPPTPLMAFADKPPPPHHFSRHIPTTPPEEPNPPPAEQEVRQDTRESHESTMNGGLRREEADNNTIIPLPLPLPPPPPPNVHEAEVIDLTASQNDDDGRGGDVIEELVPITTHEPDALHQPSAPAPAQHAQLPPQPAAQPVAQPPMAASTSTGLRREQNVEAVGNTRRSLSGIAPPQVRPAMQALQGLAQAVNHQRMPNLSYNAAPNVSFAPPQGIPYHPAADAVASNQRQAPSAASTPTNYMPPAVRQQQTVPVFVNPSIPHTSPTITPASGLHRSPSATHPPSAQLLTPVASPPHQLNGRKRPLPLDTTAQNAPARARIEPPARIQTSPQMPATRSDHLAQSLQATANSSSAPTRPLTHTDLSTPPTVVSRGAAYLATFKTTISDLQTRMTFSRAAQIRIPWIEDACRNNDLIFLLLHQLFCLWTLHGTVLENEFNMGKDCDAGFEIMALLFFRNEDLSPSFLLALAKFPNSPFALKASGEVKTWTDELRRFLPQLGGRWDLLRQSCLARRLPPTARELCEVLTCPPSIVLQKAIFTSLEKQINPYSPQNWHTYAYNLFTSSQRSYYQTDASQRLSLDDDTRMFAQAYTTQFNLHSQSLRQANFAPDLQPPNTIHSNPLGPQNNPQTSYPASHSGLRTIQPTTTQAPQFTNPSLPAQNPISAAPRVAPPQPTSRSHNQFPPSTRPQPMIPVNQPPPVFNQNRPHHLPMPNTGPPSNSLIPPARSNAPRSQQQHPRPVVNNAQPLTNNHGPIQNNFTRDQRMNVTNQAQMRPPPTPPSNTTLPTTSTPGLPVKPVNVHDTRLLPELSALPPVLTNPDSMQDALHQIHLRQPATKLKDEKATRLYQFVDSFASEPYVFRPKNAYFELPFSVPSDTLENRVETIHGSADSFQLATRKLGNDSIVLNLRCVKISNHELSGIQNANLSTWAAIPTFYPEHIFVSLNGNHLEFRRKRNYKRDLPVDVTDIVQPGNNLIRVSFHPSKDDLYNTFAIAVEIVAFQDHELVSAMPSKIAAEEALQVITAAVKPATTTGDDDVTVVNDSMSINVTDPFSLQLWTTPVRGIQCKHRECFDLQTFLQTRPSEMKDALTGVYAWICPLCFKDARPRSLVIDGFMQTVRERLIEQRREDARNIIIKSDGSWTIKEEKLEGKGPPSRRQESTANPDVDAKYKAPVATSANESAGFNLDFMEFDRSAAQPGYTATETPASESGVLEVIDLDED